MATVSLKKLTKAYGATSDQAIQARVFEQVSTGYYAPYTDSIRRMVLSGTVRDATVLSRAVGLRPARISVRVEAVAGYDRPVFACYGHGGAGFTLSWGDAERIVALIGSL